MFSHSDPPFRYDKPSIDHKAYSMSRVFGNFSDFRIPQPQSIIIQLFYGFRMKYRRKPFREERWFLKQGCRRVLPACETVWPHEDYAAPSDVHNFIVSVDPQGILGWNDKYVEKRGRPKAHVIEVLTEQADIHAPSIFPSSAIRIWHTT